MPSVGIEIKLETRPRGIVAYATLRGSKALNLVDQAILSAATRALLSTLAHPQLRCLVLTGANDKAFIGGANLDALRALGADTAESFIRSIHEFCNALRTAPVPVIAVMRGYCLGAGLEIAAACDMRIGDHSVQCGMPEVRVGVPSVVEAALLPALIGSGKARELMLRGNIVGATEAHAIGILQHLVDTSELDTLTETICSDFLAGGPQAIAAQKRLFLAWEEQPMSAAIESGVAEFISAYAGDEPQSAIAAFFSRRG